MMTWNLNTIYSSEQDLRQDVQELKELLKGSKELKDAVLKLQEAGKILHHLESYIECLLAQDPTDSQAHQKNNEIGELKACYETALFSLGNRLAQLDQPAFSELKKQLKEINFYLEELRSHAKEKASIEKEEIIYSLSSDGYHSFWSLYQAYTGNMKLGKEKLSIGQMQNRLSDPDRRVRMQAFNDWQASWKENAGFLSLVLNHIAGFRWKVYAIRGWKNILFEPLSLNRMKEETLQAMWTAVDEAKPYFLQYLQRKAELLGLEKLSWVDIEAPLYDSSAMSWEEGKQLILQQFEKFHPKKAAFARKAFEKNWIEAEDRPGKAAGGFCVSLPKNGESRIFMTYKGTPFNVATLAHELGHAYHNECVKHLPFFHQQAQMNVAETASTFGEMIVIDQAIRAEKDEHKKLKLLDDKLQRSIAYFMNLHARLLFEKAFYEERREGFVSAEKLSEMMVAAQKQAYQNSLADWEPYFWASKMHFFFTHCPFYNFPYTFGYLLSNGLYARAREESFGERFDAFLEDSAQMNVEKLAQKHLQVDLTKPDFWRDSIEILVDDIDQFLTISSHKVES